ncbi:hypothetical protein BDW66DRAFT_149922 [Aspergillus desertorum]
MEEPKDKNLRINPNITIQLWQYVQSNPLQLIDQGHHIINSQDWWAYMSTKNDHMPILPAPSPQFLIESRILGFADQPAWQWTPADFNIVNTTGQPEPGEPLLKGAVMATWNDNGPDASSKLEKFYAHAQGYCSDLGRQCRLLSPLAPAQNLDRANPVPESGSDGLLVCWTRIHSSTDSNYVKLGKSSKGMNYTCTLTVTGPFTLSSKDNTLSFNPYGILSFNEDGYIYPLRSVQTKDALELDSGHPSRIRTNSSPTHEPVIHDTAVSSPVTITIATDVEHSTVVWLDGQSIGRFEAFCVWRQEYRVQLKSDGVCGTA